MKTRTVSDGTGSKVHVAPTDYGDRVALFINQELGQCTAHLTVKQARKVIRNLQRVIRKVEAQS